MLKSLYIENFAIINSSRINFCKGLNVISGESGSGKSIIFDALMCLFGFKNGKDFWIRKDKPLYVEAFFFIDDKLLHTIKGSHPFFDILSNEIIISRVYNGNNKYFLDNKQVKRDILQGIFPYLLETCFQEESISLYKSDYLLNLIDSKVNDKEIFLKLKKIFSEYMALKRKWEEIKKNISEYKKRLDFLSFQKKEIEESGILNVNQEELEEEYEILANYEEITYTISSLLEILNNTELISFISKAYKRLISIKRLPSNIKSIVELLNSIEISLNEFRIQSENFISFVEYDEDRFRELSNLMVKLVDFQKKYGENINEITKTYNNINKEIEEIKKLLKVDKEPDDLKRIKSEYEVLAENLSNSRKLITSNLKVDIEKKLKDLMLKHSKIDFIFKRKEYTEKGFDDVSIYFTANPGMIALPIKKVVSFGEKSRLMLAIKLSFKLEGSTILFDEIEAGLGGKALDSAIKKIAKLSKINQVITITHNDSLISKADNNIRVKKVINSNKTEVIIN